MDFFSIYFVNRMVQNRGEVKKRVGWVCIIISAKKPSTIYVPSLPYSSHGMRMGGLFKSTSEARLASIGLKLPQLLTHMNLALIYPWRFDTNFHFNAISWISRSFNLRQRHNRCKSPTHSLVPAVRFPLREWLVHV